MVFHNTTSFYYTLTDHLGSIDALCDENGSVVERYSYDVWGNRRNPSDWTLADARTAWTTTPGFTGHVQRNTVFESKVHQKQNIEPIPKTKEIGKHLDKFGIINANARMYEPLTGKFLAPDPYVQAPDYSQSFNRYTYCWNNPVKYSDPSGEIILPLYFVFFTETGYDLQKYVLPMAVKVDVGFGNNQGVGIRTSVGAPQALPKSARVHGSAGYWWKNGEIPEGWMFTYGYELGISPFIIVGSTKYVTPGSPEFNQRTGHARIGIPGFNIKYENDWFFGLPIGDGGDRYRTAGAKIQVGIFSIGVNLFTGDPGLDGEDRPSESGTGIHKGKFVYSGGNANKYRRGVAYYGFGPIRLSRNSEMIRHGIQNKFAHDWIQEGRAKHFQVLNVFPTFFLYYGTGYGSGLW